MKIKSRILKDENSNNLNKKGKITTAAVCLGVAGALAIGYGATKNTSNNKTKFGTKQETNNEKISFEDTENCELVYITNSINNETEPYVIEIEEVRFPVRYKINDIYTGNTLLELDFQHKNVDEDSILSIEFKGYLDEYLIAYNNLKQEYNKDEFKAILDKERESIKNNKKQRTYKKVNMITKR